VFFSSLAAKNESLLPVVLVSFSLFLASILDGIETCFFVYRRPENPRPDIARKFKGAMGQLKSVRKDSVESLHWIRA
jgi:hypothetical protein